MPTETRTRPATPTEVRLLPSPSPSPYPHPHPFLSRITYLPCPDPTVRSAAARLSLSHCFGYDGDVSRHGHSVQGRNLLLLPLDQGDQGDQLLLFPAAALVVLMSLHSKRQRCAPYPNLTTLYLIPSRPIPDLIEWLLHTSLVDQVLHGTQR